MAYIKQNKIHVFPFGNTRASDPSARTLNEHNISGIIRHITDRSSYVIKTYTEENSRWVEFVLEGYYFKADVSDIAFDYDSGTNETKLKPLYASVDIQEYGNLICLAGGDAIGSISSGEGSLNSPYVMSKGPLNLSVDNSDGSKDLYFTYTHLEEEEKGGTVTIHKNGSFQIEKLLVDNQPVSMDRVDDTKTEKIIDVYPSEVLTIIVQTNDTDTSVIGMDVIYSDVFTGIKFFNDPSDPEYVSAKYKLYLLDNEHEVPEDSFIKFESRSFGGGISTNIDVIYCGNATTVTGGNLPESGDNSVDRIYCGNSSTLV